MLLGTLPIDLPEFPPHTISRPTSLSVPIHTRKMIIALFLFLPFFSFFSGVSATPLSFFFRDLASQGKRPLVRSLVPSRPSCLLFSPLVICLAVCHSASSWQLIIGTVLLRPPTLWLIRYAEYHYTCTPHAVRRHLYSRSFQAPFP